VGNAWRPGLTRPRTLLLLATAVILLLAIPFAMLISELDDLWANIRFWTAVLAIWAAVWLAISYN
jgi:hypothetical protein